MKPWRLLGPRERRKKEKCGGSPPSPRSRRPRGPGGRAHLIGQASGEGGGGGGAANHLIPETVLLSRIVRNPWAVLAADVGGRWFEEVRAFLSQLAKAKARSAPHMLAGRVRQAYHRWSPSWLALEQGLLHYFSWRRDLLWGVTATHRLCVRLLCLSPLAT